YRFPEAGAVDAHEVDQFAFGGVAERGHNHHGGGLGHGLDNQDARHHRLSREVALEERLIGGDILDADRGFGRDDILEPVDHQHGIAMRDHFHDPVDIDREAG